LEIEDNPFELTIYPNPVSSKSYIQFKLEEKSNVSLALLDNNGKLVHKLLERVENSGLHKVLLSGFDLPTGIFHCVLKAEDVVSVKRIVVD